MAKGKSLYYECVYPCDLPHYGPDHRKERFKEVGMATVPDPHVLHSLRFYPRKGPLAMRGPHFIRVHQPLGAQYTDVITKKVKRAKIDLHGNVIGHKMVEKYSKVKFVLLDSDNLTDSIKNQAYDFGEAWGPEMFITINADVLPDNVNRPVQRTGDEDKDDTEEGDAGTQS